MMARIRQALNDSLGVHRRLANGVFVGGFALVGVLVLGLSRAATQVSSFEAEAGTRSGNLAVVSDSSASGGTAVQFGPAAEGTWNGDNLNTHQVLVDGSNKLMPWSKPANKAYANAAFLSMDYLLNKVPNDPSTGKPAYLSRSKLDANSQTVMNWPSNPAGMFGMIIDSSTRYYTYSGNGEAITLARRLADQMLSTGMTPVANSWGGVPNSSGEWGELVYQGSSYGDGHNGQGDGLGVIQPDKTAEFSIGLLRLYQITGDTRYCDAAITSANELVEHIRTGSATQSPWPFRVKASNNSIVQQYGANVIAPIKLFDYLEELNLGNVASYQTARTTAWNWLMAYPIQNNKWDGYFEDMPNDPNITNNNQLVAGNTAIYLLQNQDKDPQWQSHVSGIISFIQNTFGDQDYGATKVNEQTDFNDRPMGSHTSRFATVNALYYEKTGDSAARERAYRSYNWATYMARSNGVVIDSPVINEIWFTDGYGDYIKHFIMGMGAVPEWAPNGETHLLESTAEVIKSVMYGTSNVTYTAGDSAGTEVIRVAQTPTGVTLGGNTLTKRSDLNAEGWTYNAASTTLKIRRTSGSNVVVNF